VFAYTRTNIVVTDSYQSDSVRGIFRQTVERDFLWEIITGYKLESDREILVDKSIHATFYLLLLLTGGLVVEIETHLALLTLHMGIIAPLTTEDTDHRLVKQMLCSMSGRKLVFIMFVEKHLTLNFELYDYTFKP
jgi:hypothetical protein